MVLKKNDTIELYIEDFGSDGEGIGKYKGFPLFVKDAVIGDRIEALILKVKKSYGYAKLVKILEPSEFRVTPCCVLASKCGGCKLQHVSYERQLEYKQNKVKNCLRRIAGLSQVDEFMEPIIGMEEPYYYRNKAQFPVGRDKAGKIVIGFYVGHSHTIIDTSHCYIQAKVNERIIEIVRGFLEEENISIYNEELHQGLVRHILTRVGFSTGEIMVCLVINGTALPRKERLIDRLMAINEEKTDDLRNKYDLHYKVKSICLNMNTEKTNVILGNVVKPVWGETFITDYIGNIKYQISPLSFFQVNQVQTKKLYEKALEYADLSGNEIVWDLYCGIGTISLFLAGKAKQVYGVEIIPQAIADAVKNAKINEISNAEFFVGAAEEILPLKYKQSNGQMRADVIVLDPPRKGCEESLLETIVHMKPEKIVYVSCDPATLARDVKYLMEAGYHMERGVAIDNFAHTSHVETVCLLSRKG